MWNNESKLTKYTLIGCTLLLIAYFSASARADDTETADDWRFVTVVCSYAEITTGGDDVEFWRARVLALFTKDEYTVALNNTLVELDKSGITHEDLFAIADDCHLTVELFAEWGVLQ